MISWNNDWIFLSFYQEEAKAAGIVAQIFIIWCRARRLTDMSVVFISLQLWRRHRCALCVPPPTRLFQHLFFNLDGLFVGASTSWIFWTNSCCVMNNYWGNVFSFFSHTVHVLCFAWLCMPELVALQLTDSLTKDGLFDFFWPWFRCSASCSGGTDGAERCEVSYWGVVWTGSGSNLHPAVQEHFKTGQGKRQNTWLKWGN